MPHARYLIGGTAPENIRVDTIEDQEFLVVPVVALVEGVIQCATCPEPEFVSRNEFGRTPAMWDGRPVVVNHPMMNGVPISANSPSVFEKEVIGHLFNTSLDGEKLKTEAWINLEKVDKLGGEVLETVDRIRSGEQVEVSTGYFADVDATTGLFKGQQFAGVQRDLKPDHLALLTDGIVGACDWEMGCGAPRINQAQSLSSCDCDGNACNCGSQEMTEVQCIANLVDADQFIYRSSIPLSRILKVTVNGKEQVTGFEIIANRSAIKFSKAFEISEGEEVIITGYPSPTSETIPDHVLSSLFSNQEMSDTDLRRALEMALKEKDDIEFPFIVAVFSNNFIFEEGFGVTLKSRSFSINEDGVITLGDEMTIVRPVTEFIPVVTNSEDIDMTKKETRVKGLIDNEATRFTESDRDFLMDLSEDQLEKFEPVEAASGEEEESEEEASNSNSEEEASNAENENAENENAGSGEEGSSTSVPVTAEQYINQAPKEIQSLLNSGLSMHRERRGELVKALTANGRCQFTKEQLEGMEIDYLEKLATLADLPDFSNGRPVPRTNQVDDEEVPATPAVFDLNAHREAS